MSLSEEEASHVQTRRKSVPVEKSSQCEDTFIILKKQKTPVRLEVVERKKNC